MSVKQTQSFFQYIHWLFKAFFTVFITLSFFTASAAYALTPPSISEMLANLSETVPQLMRLVTAIAYVVGMIFCVKGVIGLKSYGESKGHHEHGAKGPLILLAVGAALLYLPSSVQSGISTFWDNTSPIAYEPATSGAWSDLLKDVFAIITLVGTIAFIRGLIMLTKLGSGGGHQASLGKALTHMIAGIFCINMYQFLDTIFNTLGLGQLMS